MRPLGVRTAPALLGTLLGAVLVVGCGTDSGTGGSDSARDSRSAPLSSSPSATTTSAPSGSPAPSSGLVDFTVVQILSATQGGGRVSPAAVAVPDVDAARRFAVQFGDSGLAGQVVGAVDVAQVPAGSMLYAAVVSRGCDVPREVEVSRTDSGFAVEPAAAPSPGVQCFAPVTTVALVAIAA